MKVSGPFRFFTPSLVWVRVRVSVRGIVTDGEGHTVCGSEDNSENNFSSFMVHERNQLMALLDKPSIVSKICNNWNTHA